MGRAAVRRRNFLAKNPYCAFCGGGEAAVTIEHCPPRAMFQYRKWPVGFEFPACEPCNHNSANKDLLVSMLARLDPFTGRGDEDGRQMHLTQSVNEQFPGLLARMNLTPTEARATNREYGLVPLPGQTHQEVGMMALPEEFQDAVMVFSRKLAKGIFFLHTGSIFPSTGELLLNWSSNVELLNRETFPTFEALNGFFGESPAVVRSGTHLSDQFSYKITLAPTHQFLLIQARFGNSFGLVIVACTQAGILANTTAVLRQQYGREGPFTEL